MAKEYTVTTLALGEEDGTPEISDTDYGNWVTRPPFKPIDPGDYWATTMACGEEGNDCGLDPIEVTTMALGEEGDYAILEPEPIEYTTMALGEEGDEDIVSPEPIEFSTMALGEEGDSGTDDYM